MVRIAFSHRHFFSRQGGELGRGGVDNFGSSAFLTAGVKKYFWGIFHLSAELGMRQMSYELSESDDEDSDSDGSYSDFYGSVNTASFGARGVAGLLWTRPRLLIGLPRFVFGVHF